VTEKSNTAKLIKAWYGETKYPSGATITIKIELFDDGQLIKTEKDEDLKSTVTFYKKYKCLDCAKKKLDRLRDDYLGYSP